MKKNVGKAPSRQFYFKDFLADMEEYPAEVVGCWIKVLCKIWLNGKAGKITRTLEEFSMLFNIDLQKTEEIIKYLQNSKIANVTNRNKNITITNRREVREHKNRENNRLRQQRYRNEKKHNAIVAQKRFNPSTSSSSSSSTSSSLNKKHSMGVCLNNHTISKEQRENQAIYPAIQEVIDVFTLQGITKEEAEIFYNQYDSQGWLWGNGQPITNLTSAAARWKRLMGQFPQRKNESIADRVKRLKDKGQL